MIGQVPVDSAAPNVFVTEDGKGTIYDSTLEQEMWQRWEHGDFTTDDAESATAWRAGVQSINLHAVGKQWKEFAKERFGSASNLPQLIALVDDMLNERDSKTQFKLLVMLMVFLHVSLSAAEWATKLFNAGLMPRVKDLAPYAASVLRLYGHNSGTAKHALREQLEQISLDVLEKETDLSRHTILRARQGLRVHPRSLQRLRTAAGSIRAHER
jgi:hypothetical protein